MKRLIFIAAALVSAALCFWIAWIPLGILFGKIPHPPTSQIVDIGARYSLAPLIIGLALHLTGLLSARKGGIAASVVLLVAAPAGSFAMLYLVFLR